MTPPALTTSQQHCLAGFKAALSVRGIAVALSGTQFEFIALVDDKGASPAEFEVSASDVHATDVHILNSAQGISEIKFGSLLVEAKSGTIHRVVRRTAYAFKTVFGCVID
jgi:hypothetical protein